MLLPGCGKQPTAPAEPPGKLVGVVYERGGSMERGNDYYVSVTEERIELIKYFDTQEMDYIETEDVPLDESRWEDIESAVFKLWPTLEEKEPKKNRSVLSWMFNGFSGGEPMLRDGGDYTNFSLVWETSDGVVTSDYRWNNSEPLYYELATLLKALAPQ